MHWHTETTVADLASHAYLVERTADDDPQVQPDDAVVDAAYTAAESLAQAISAPPEALVTLDRNRDSETSSQSISVTVTVA